MLAGMETSLRFDAVVHISFHRLCMTQRCFLVPKKVIKYDNLIVLVFFSDITAPSLDSLATVAEAAVVGLAAIKATSCNRTRLPI